MTEARTTSRQMYANVQCTATVVVTCICVTKTEKHTTNKEFGTQNRALKWKNRTLHA